MGNPNWTKREDEILKNNYGKISYKEILKLLPPYRTINSINYRAFLLKICCQQGKNKFSRTCPRKKVNDVYFSEFNKENCYWAGFLVADGSIKKNNKLKLKLASHDEQHLIKFKNCIKSENKIYKNKFFTASKTISASCELEITSKKICDDLKNNWNITSKKTFSYYPPYFKNKNYLDCFIIGLLDGDGTIGYYGKFKYLSIIICGNINVCKLIKKRFEEISGKKCQNISKQNNSFRFSVTGYDAEKIFNYLKQYNIPKLERKWNWTPKGWGFERTYVNNGKYCGKLLFLKKNKKFSYHYHKIKEESFLLQAGRVLIKWSDDSDKLEEANETILTPGDVFHVPIGRRHQIISLKYSSIIEFSTQHFDSDSYRIVKGD